MPIRTNFAGLTLEQIAEQHPELADDIQSFIEHLTWRLKADTRKAEQEQAWLTDVESARSKITPPPTYPSMLDILDELRRDFGTMPGFAVETAVITRMIDREEELRSAFNRLRDGTEEPALVYEFLMNIAAAVGEFGGPYQNGGIAQEEIRKSRLELANDLDAFGDHMKEALHRLHSLQRKAIRGRCNLPRYLSDQRWIGHVRASATESNRHYTMVLAVLSELAKVDRNIPLQDSSEVIAAAMSSRKSTDRDLVRVLEQRIMEELTDYGSLPEPRLRFSNAEIAALVNVCFGLEKGTVTKDAISQARRLRFDV